MIWATLDVEGFGTIFTAKGGTLLICDVAFALETSATPIRPALLSGAVGSMGAVGAHAVGSRLLALLSHRFPAVSGVQTQIVQSQTAQ